MLSGVQLVLSGVQLVLRGVQLVLRGSQLVLSGVQLVLSGVQVVLGVDRPDLLVTLSKQVTWLDTLFQWDQIHAHQ